MQMEKFSELWRKIFSCSHIKLIKEKLKLQVMAGKNKGLKLIGPKENIRPTLSRIKEAIFSSISRELVGKSFLDAFCGTGQMGIEAISRGASFSMFIDVDTEIVKKNINKIKLINSDSFKIRKLDLTKNKEMIKTNIAFVDPPYNINLSFLNFIEFSDFLILEQHVNTTIALPENFEIFKEKKYAHTKIYFIERL